MAMKETKRKIYFSSYTPQKGREKDTSAPPYVRVSKKYGTLTFGSKALAKMQMEGKLVSFYYESGRKIIGWKVENGNLNLQELKGHRHRLVKKDAQGQWTASVKGILDQFIGLNQDSYKCEVKKYIETSDTLSRGDWYYYIRLRNSSDGEAEDE